MRYFNSIGLAKEKLEEIIDEVLEKNADILIGIDDPEVIEMIEILKKSFSRAIEENNKRLEKDIEEMIKDDKEKSRSLRGRYF